MSDREWIICSAVHIDDGGEYPHQPRNIATGLVVCGRRHHNCFVTLSLTSISVKQHKCVQGFLTSTDRFVDRREAMTIARREGQLMTEDYEGNSLLFSEDLYSGIAEDLHTLSEGVSDDE